MSISSQRPGLRIQLCAFKIKLYANELQQIRNYTLKKYNEMQKVWQWEWMSRTITIWQKILLPKEVIPGPTGWWQLISHDGGMCDKHKNWLIHGVEKLQSQHIFEDHPPTVMSVPSSVTKSFLGKFPSRLPRFILAIYINHIKFLPQILLKENLKTI